MLGSSTSSGAADRQPPAHIPPVLASGPDKVLSVLAAGIPLLAFFSIAAMQTCMALAILAWLVARRGRWSGPLPPVVIPFALYFAASLLSALAARDWEALAELRECLLPVVVYVVLDQLSSRERVERVLKALLAGAVLAALLGIAQVVEHGTVFRVKGTLSDYMTYAGLQQMAALLLVARLLWWRRGTRDTLLHLLALALVLVALVFTQTRGAWLGVVLGCALLGGLSRPRYLLALPLLLGLAAGSIQLFGSEAIRTRVASLTDLGDRTLENRLYLWRAGLGMVRANPVLGVGIERTDEVYDDYMLPGDIWYEDYSHSPGQLNSNFIHIAAERGLVGLAAWLSIWVAFFAQVWRVWRRCEQDDDWSRAVVAGSAAALFAFLCQGVFEYNYNDSEVVTVAYVLMALPLGVGRILAHRAES